MKKKGKCVLSEGATYARGKGEEVGERCQCIQGARSGGCSWRKVPMWKVSWDEAGESNANQPADDAKDAERQRRAVCYFKERIVV